MSEEQPVGRGGLPAPKPDQPHHVTRRRCWRRGVAGKGSSMGWKGRVERPLTMAGATMPYL